MIYGSRIAFWQLARGSVHFCEEIEIRVQDSDQALRTVLITIANHWGEALSPDTLRIGLDKDGRGSAKIFAPDKGLWIVLSSKGRLPHRIRLAGEGGPSQRDQ